MQKLLGILDSPRRGRYSCRFPVSSLLGRQQVLLRRPCWSVGAHAPGSEKLTLWRLRNASSLNPASFLPCLPPWSQDVWLDISSPSVGPGSFTSQSLMPKAPAHIVSLPGFLLTGFHPFPSFQSLCWWLDFLCCRVMAFGDSIWFLMLWIHIGYI